MHRAPAKDPRNFLHRFELASVTSGSFQPARCSAVLASLLVYYVAMLHLCPRLCRCGLQRRRGTMLQLSKTSPCGRGTTSLWPTAHPQRLNSSKETPANTRSCVSVESGDHQAAARQHTRREVLAELAKPVEMPCLRGHNSCRNTRAQRHGKQASGPRRTAPGAAGNNAKTEAGLFAKTAHAYENRCLVLDRRHTATGREATHGSRRHDQPLRTATSSPAGRRTATPGQGAVGARCHACGNRGKAPCKSVPPQRIDQSTFRPPKLATRPAPESRHSGRWPKLAAPAPKSRCFGAWPRSNRAQSEMTRSGPNRPCAGCAPVPRLLTHAPAGAPQPRRLQLPTMTRPRRWCPPRCLSAQPPVFVSVSAKENSFGAECVQRKGVITELRCTLHQRSSWSSDTTGIFNYLPQPEHPSETSNMQSRVRAHKLARLVLATHASQRSLLDVAVLLEYTAVCRGRDFKRGCPTRLLW